MALSGKSLLKWLGALVLLLAAVMGVSLLIGGEYETEQSVERTFALDANFTDVRKILVRTDGAKQIITMAGDSEFIDQKWSAVGLDLDTAEGQPMAAGRADPGPLLQLMLNPQWKIELHGQLRVRSKDEYIGQPEVRLKQDVEIKPDFLHSEVDLEEPTTRLRDYKMTTHFGRDDADKGSVVKLTLTQRILTDAPWFAHGIADRRVRASAARALENQERAIRQLIADNIEDVPVFPLR